MKQARLLVAVALLLGVGAQAQTPTDVEMMRLTSNPAYVLLGVEPTNIERPSSPREFIVGAQTGMVNGQLAPNFAMELNPFNWGAKQQMDKASPSDRWFVAANYLTSTNWWVNFKNTFGLSVATTASDTVAFGSLRPGTGLSYGVKVMLYSGTARKGVAGQFMAWEKADVLAKVYDQLIIIRSMSDEGLKAAQLEDLRNRQIIATRARQDLHPDHIEAIVELIDQTMNANLTKFGANELTDNYLEAEAAIHHNVAYTAATAINGHRVPFEKMGFMLEFAAAGVSVFQDNDWSGAVWGRSAIWLTPSYKWDVGGKGKTIQTLDWLGVVRGTFNDPMVDNTSYFDFGTKLQYNIEDFSLSAEGIARWASALPADRSSAWTYRAVGNICYTLMDNITVKISVGTNFDGNSSTYTDPDELLAIAGHNFGILR